MNNLSNTQAAIDPSDDVQSAEATQFNQELQRRLNEVQHGMKKSGPSQEAVPGTRSQMDLILSGKVMTDSDPRLRHEW